MDTVVGVGQFHYFTALTDGCGHSLYLIVVAHILEELELDIYKKIGVTAGQFYTGCGFAILGVVAELFFRHLISVNKGTYMDTFGSIMGAWNGCFLGLLIGVSLYGYNFLKRNRRQNEFLKFLIISAFGISLGLYVPHFILTDLGGVYELHWMFQLFLMISIPITGISLGSILVLTKGQE